MTNISAKLTTLLLAVGLLGATAGFAGCASKQKLPDDPGGNGGKNEYRSTQEDSASDSADGTRGGGGTAEKNGQQADSGNTARGAQGGQGQKKQSMPRATGPIATINGEPLPAEEFNAEIEKVAKSQQFPARLLRHFQSRLVDRLIDRKLIQMEMEDSSVEVTDEEIDEKLEQVKAEFEEVAKASGKEGATLEQITEQYGISNEDLRQSLRESIALEKYLVQERRLELPSDEDIKEYYEDNKQQFTRPAQVEAHHLFLKVDQNGGEKAWETTKAEAQKLRQKLVEGGDGEDASFADVARENSDGPLAKKGGEIGYISKQGISRFISGSPGQQRQKPVPETELAKAAFELEDGEVTEPVKSKLGWHLIKVTGRKEADVVPFEKVQMKLTKKLRSGKIKKAASKLVKDLRSEADIEKHPENIK